MVKSFVGNHSIQCWARSSAELTDPGRRRENREMGRYRHQIYAQSGTPRFCVLFGLQWQVIECSRFEPGADLRGAMTAAISRLANEGWQMEGGEEFGFVFMRRAGERRLLILTERDPQDMRPQAFSPYA
jgi:hypothetical protein